ncbi:hypothetical protein ACFWIB_39255 [Streptomyces sp. NPDC127051]|uniref:hypothetical protein n=1 Tax=Streptomyces sp. NPDC127051 TaxID=3347119 RepID=UPI00365C7DC9
MAVLRDRKRSASVENYADDHDEVADAEIVEAEDPDAWADEEAQRIFEQHGTPNSLALSYAIKTYASRHTKASTASCEPLSLVPAFLMDLQEYEKWIRNPRILRENLQDSEKVEAALEKMIRQISAIRNKRHAGPHVDAMLRRARLRPPGDTY